MQPPPGAPAAYCPTIVHLPRCRLLADPNFQATLFVPTNRAWASLLRVLGRSREQLLAADPAARQALTQTVEARSGSGAGGVGARLSARRRPSSRTYAASEGGTSSPLPPFPRWHSTTLSPTLRCRWTRCGRCPTCTA